MTTDTSHVAVDCYTRSSVAVDAVDNSIAKLRTYEEEGRITELSIDIWPDTVRLTDDTVGSSVLSHYNEFRRWADDEGVSLEPAFTRRERTTMLNDTADTILGLPVLCLAVRLDGELVSVAPHSTETTTYTVRDALVDISSFPQVLSSDDLSELHPDHLVRSAISSQTTQNRPTSTTNEENIL